MRVSDGVEGSVTVRVRMSGGTLVLDATPSGSSSSSWIGLGLGLGLGSGLGSGLGLGLGLVLGLGLAVQPLLQRGGVEQPAQHLGRGRGGVGRRR